MSRVGLAIITVLVILGVGALIQAAMSVHDEFAARCEALGGKKDDVNRGFFCIKNGVYIEVPHVTN